MSLTNRILVSMVAGVLAGSLINLVLHATSIDAGARMVLEDWLVKENAKNGVKVNGAKVVQADIEASNGVIHVVDAVILPE